MREVKERLLEIYDTFVASIEATKRVTDISVEIFEDLPYNILKIMRTRARSAIDSMYERFVKLIEPRDNDSIVPMYVRELRSRLPTKEPWRYENKRTKRLEALSYIFGFERLREMDKQALLKNINFENLLLSQALVMFYAYFDAFLTDNYRILLDIELEKLKQKQTKGSKLLYGILEQNSIDFGYKPINVKMKLLNSEIMENLFADKKLIKQLTIGLNIRHLYVHNSGRINKKFIKQTKLKELKVGDKYVLADDDLTEIYDIMSNLALLIHNGIYLQCVSKSKK
ncbi:MAG: hypothetical protein KAU62_13950 [Candidatus Heimdallarchaeota archaeon]|nr:hypothetical protein [Candidatus Heimdallarchaeota archaeon]MCK4612254.1 hypothetical protein [Candidatus Heimdallarchaeota archaeon]